MPASEFAAATTAARLIDEADTARGGFAASTAALPLDARLLHGTLANGLEYYVRANAKPSRVVEFRLIVNVGSVAERDDERGVAHFVEHMGFKGTERFDHGELIKKLEALGCRYGQHLNAHTGQFETVYKLSVPVSHETAEARVASALAILREWASHVRVSDEDVETERRVIEEEWRSKNGPQRRVLHKYWAKVFGDGGANLIAERMPIGLVDVIRHCPAATIRAFYKRWYRPENMAVVVVGDFDDCCAEGDGARWVECALADAFASVPRTPDAERIALPVAPLPRHGVGGVVCALTDAELTQASVSLEFYEPLTVAPTLAHVTRDVGRRLLTTLVDQRLGACARRGGRDAPFLTAGVSSRPVVRDLLCTAVSAVAKHDDASVERAITAVQRECARFAAHGFTAGELAMAKTKWTAAFAAQLADVANTRSESICEEYSTHFTRAHATPLAGPELELELCARLVERAQLDDVNALAARLFAPAASGSGEGYASEVFRALFVQRPLVESPPDATPDPASATPEAAASSSADDALHALWELTLADVRASPPGPPVDTPSSETLMYAPPVGGHVVARSPLASLGAEELTLSNGTVVCLKRDASNARQSVSFQAFALGGSTELTEEEEASFALVDEVAGQSGLGALDGDALVNLRSTHRVRVNTQRHLFFRGLGGSAPAARVELLLQMLHLKLARGAQPFARTALEKAAGIQLEGVAHREKNPEFYIAERARLLAYGDVPAMRPPSERALKAASEAELARLYAAAFCARPSEFTFVFVGDLPHDEVLVPLLEQYLGGLGVDDANRTDAASPPALDGLSGCGCDAATSEVGGFARLAACVCTPPPPPPETAAADPWAGIVSSKPIAAPFAPAREVVRRGQTRDGKAAVFLMWKVTLPADSRDESQLIFRVKAATSFLEARLLTTLRTEQSAVYNVNVGWSRASLDCSGLVTVEFGCDPRRAADVERALHDELGRARSHGPDDDELTAVRSLLAENHARATQNNSYWQFWLLDAYKAYEARVRAGALAYNGASSRAEWVEHEAAQHALDVPARAAELTAGAIQETLAFTMPPDCFVSLTLMPDNAALAPDSEVLVTATETPKAIPASA